MTVQYTLVGGEDGANISVFVPGHDPLVAHSSHPNFEAILAGAIDSDPSIVDLFDIAKTAISKFETLSERMSHANGRLFLDGVEINNAESAQILRFMQEGVDDWKPLVKFFENVQANPNEHSREQLYEWLSRRDFAITPEGLIVGYKGVDNRFSDGKYYSINSGRAIVNGEVQNGRIENPIGAVVEMPRDQVEWNPAVGCHTGLHVGTYDYASSFARGALLEVHVNPRDVVSVPTESDHAKMRVCRYRVIQAIDKPYAAPLVDDYYEDLFDDDADYEWGDWEVEDSYAPR